MTNIYFLSVLVTNLVVNSSGNYVIPAIIAPNEWFDNHYAEQLKHGSGTLTVHSNYVARLVVDGRTNDFTLHSAPIGQQGVTWYDRTVREWATNEWQEVVSPNISWVTNTASLYITNVIGDSAFTNLLIR